MDAFSQEDESYLSLANWKKIKPTLRVGFTLRRGGISKPPYDSLNMGLHVLDSTNDVISNRNNLAQKQAMPIEYWVSGQQVHGTKIEVIDDRVKGRGALSYNDSLPEIDGLITNQKGILCTAFFADCVPLFFFDPVTEYVGIAHAGWKGTVNGIGKKMIEKFLEVGVDIKTLRVAIGPCISQAAYEVDDNVIKNLTAEQISNTTHKLNDSQYLLNLKKLNMEILLQSGALRHNIEVTNYCTYRDNELFFSHRRDQGKTGRMLGFIGFQE